MSVWLPPLRRSLRGDERTFGVRGNRAEVVAIFLHDAYSVDIKVNLARAQSKNLYSVLDVCQRALTLKIMFPRRYAACA